MSKMHFVREGYTCVYDFFTDYILVINKENNVFNNVFYSKIWLEHDYFS